MQALSDNRATRSRVAGVDYLALWLGCRRRDLTSVFCASPVQNGRVRRGRTWREPGGKTLTRQSVIPSGSSSAINLQLRSSHICYCYCIVGHSLGALVHLKTRTLHSDITSVDIFSCFKKFKCLDVLDSVTPITICNIEVPSFGRFYNLAQILI